MSTKPGQLHSNAVLRLEYRPRSALYLVWAQRRDESLDRGAFDLSGDLHDLFSVHPRNVFMLKASYWLNP